VRRQLALAAADRREYETFHDLAWRAVQTGPPRDPSLMLLLARAQALSGRPHDALVMIDRLAQMGVASDAATSDDFGRTRELPGWPEVAARLERLTHPNAPATAPPPARAPAARSAPVAPAAPAKPISPDPVAPPPDPTTEVRAAPASGHPEAFTPAPVSEAARFSSERFAVAGLAYDGVSGRYLFADRTSRKLIVVSEGSNRALDLVRGESAGFRDITALEVDPRRGDLWVASSAAEGEAAALHKLQTVSGRPLKSYPIAAGDETVALTDVAISSTGTVLTLDAANKRILALRPGESAVKPLVSIRVENATSIAAAREEAIAYVAHRDGIQRVDLLGRSASRVSAPRGTTIAGIERVRWYKNALIVAMADENGSRRIVRLDLNPSGRAVTKATTLQAGLAGATLMTIAGDDLLYVQASMESGSPVSTALGLPELVTYRLKLR